MFGAIEHFNKQASVAVDFANSTDNARSRTIALDRARYINEMAVSQFFLFLRSGGEKFGKTNAIKQYPTSARRFLKMARRLADNIIAVG